MIERLRRHRTLLTGGAQLLLLLIGLRFNSRGMWLLCLGGIVAISFYAWVAMVRRWRAIGDTPTSLVGSAAQGYVELAGVARSHPAEKLRTRHSQIVCCWYRYMVQKKRGSKWRTVEEGESTERFLLVDRSGAATVDPAGAEVLPQRRKTWREDNYQYTEWLILDGDPLYVLGEFGTHRPIPTARELHQDVGDLLAAWKTDQPALARRFDLNGNGRIDFEEWTLARADARRQVQRTHDELRAKPATDVMQRPADGRLYLIANVDRNRLQRSHAAWAWVHLAALLFAVVAIAWIAFGGSAPAR